MSLDNKSIVGKKKKGLKMIDENELLSEISKLKKNMKSENSDYLSGYISALSTVEGTIAGYDKTENSIRNKAIDEFAERLRLDFLESCFHETHMFTVLKVAEEMKQNGVDKR